MELSGTRWSPSERAERRVITSRRSLPTELFSDDFLIETPCSQAMRQTILGAPADLVH